MNISQITQKKQQRQALTYDELFFVVDGFVKDEIGQQDMAKFLLAVVEFGMTEQETFDLTHIMWHSGQTFDLSQFENTIDKHSTGGVSDSTTLIVVPLFALLGYTCIKMSGAGLSHTGGTADKILAFIGFNNTLTFEQAKQVAQKAGGCFITSSTKIAPADKKIYALRDKINAMSIPLIASSIMSKKLASGAKNLVLDVKYGNGAFMKNKAQAHALGRLMQKIGNHHGVQTTYILGDMNQPLGQFVGDVLEVWEVLELLKNPKPTRLLKHSIDLVALPLSKTKNISFEHAWKMCYDLIESGQVLQKLRQIVALQGGSFDLANKTFKPSHVVCAPKSGTVGTINTKQLGLLDKQFKTLEGYLGFCILAEKGQSVTKGQPIFELYFDTENIENIKKQFINTIRINHENSSYLQK